jgi:arylsulfatase
VSGRGAIRRAAALVAGLTALWSIAGSTAWSTAWSTAGSTPGPPQAPGSDRPTADDGPATPPPNVVLIVTDDQGYADLGCYGGGGRGGGGFATPRIDALAAEGLRALDFQVSQATCTSSRASFLTGCYANRVGLEGALMPWSKVGLDPRETTLAELFRDAGYRTLFVGKWHLGHQPEHRPTRHGFDHWFGLPHSNDMWPVDFDGNPVDEDHRKARYPPLVLFEDDRRVAEIATLADQATLTARYTERALEFLEQASDGPFFLQLMHSMPHVPLGPSAPFRGSTEQGAYGDVIAELDASTGRLVDALERLGVADRTLVVFTSDNGPWLNYGDHAGSAGPLREGKGSAWEGGSRVPFVARLPGVIPSGAVSDGLMASIDLLPTFAELCGLGAPELEIDGVSLLPHWRDPAATPSPRRRFLHYYNGALHAVREGRFKLHLPHTYRSYARLAPGSGGRPGPTATGRVSNALYDLDDDVGERRDVSDLHPDVVERLLALAEAAREELGDGPRRGRGQREPARSD